MIGRRRARARCCVGSSSGSAPVDGALRRARSPAPPPLVVSARTRRASARAPPAKRRRGSARGTRAARERRQHLRQHEPQRLLVIPRDEFGEAEQVRGQRRQVVPHLRRSAAAFRAATSDVGTTSTTTPASARPREPNPTSAPRLDGESVGNPVVERGERRDGKGDAGDGHGISRRRTRASRGRTSRRHELQCSKCSTRAAATSGKSLVYNDGKNRLTRLWIILCVSDRPHFADAADASGEPLA